MTVEEALPWLQEHKDELLQSIREGRYKPSPVRRKEIPKPDGNGVWKLGIPTVIDRVIQQAIAQKLPVKAYAEEGYSHAVEIDLSKYFDTLNHELLMNLLRKQITDHRVTDLIKKYLKSGVMENGVHCKTEEGSPQGGPLSPLLANIYLNEFDQEMSRREVNVIRYADDSLIPLPQDVKGPFWISSAKKLLTGCIIHFSALGMEFFETLETVQSTPVATV